jgi:tRNA (guanine37-N1)-methyltransferase
MTTLREALKGKLTKAELIHLKTSFDVVGDIAILEIDDKLKKKEKLIAETLLKLHKNIKVVCKKAGIHKGEFRTRRLTILAGERRKETTHTENRCRFKLHLEKTYFSVRFGTERGRIAQLVKPGEKVLVMFSGIAPFPLVIAKNANPAMVYGVEKNPAAHRCAIQNLKLNKAGNIRIHLGDVRRVLPQLRIMFDRVVMPLPKGGEGFLTTAIRKLKSGGTLHFYDFLHQDDFRQAEDKVKAACKLLNRGCKISKAVKCGQYGPRIYRICVDSVVS